MLTAKKTPLGAKTRKMKAVYHAFAIGGTAKKGALTADVAQNCDCGGGALTTAPRVMHYYYKNTFLNVDLSGISLRGSFVSLEKNEEGELCELFGCVSTRNTLHIYSGGKMVQIGAFSSCSRPIRAMEGKDGYKTVFATAEGVYCIENGGIKLTSEIACLPVICVYKGRVFTATADGVLVYSAPYAPTDFTETLNGGGRIRLDTRYGKVVGIIPLKNELCVFFENGISVFDIAGAARKFVRRDIPLGGGSIFGDTICVGGVSGEAAFFLSTEGVYRFDGAKAERICKNLPVEGFVAFSYGVIAAGKYYVSYYEENEVWRTIAVDVESGEGGFMMPMYGLGGGEGHSLFWDGLSLYEISRGGILPTGKKATFTLESADFSVAGEKTLKALEFMGEGAVTVSVSAGARTMKKSVDFANGRARVPLGVRGQSFQLKLELEKKSRLFGMTAELEKIV